MPKNGSAPDPISPETALAAAALAMSGQGRRVIQAETGATEAQARLAARCGMDPTDFRQQLATKVEEIATNLAHSIAESVKAGTLEPRDQLIGFGIMVDKHEALTGSKASPILHQTNIQINGMSRQEALSALAGQRTGLFPQIEANNAHARDIDSSSPIETCFPKSLIELNETGAGLILNKRSKDSQPLTE